jgi:ribosome-binding protein aMBF1 (putative translation factor)
VNVTRGTGAPLQAYRNEQLADPEVTAAYEAVSDAYRIARAILEARVQSKLTQEALAARMGTTQSVIARLESGRTMPSTWTLVRLAEATGTAFCPQFIAK